MHRVWQSWTLPDAAAYSRWHFEILPETGNNIITWQTWIAAARVTDTMIYAFCTRVGHMSCLMEDKVVTSLRHPLQPTGLKTDIFQQLGTLPSSDVIPIIQIVVKRRWVAIRKADGTREGLKYIGIRSIPSVTVIPYWKQTYAPYRKPYKLHESELYVKIHFVPRRKHTSSSHLAGVRQIHTGFLWENLKNRDHLE